MMQACVALMFPSLTIVMLVLDCSTIGNNCCYVMLYVIQLWLAYEFEQYRYLFVFYIYFLCVCLRCVAFVRSWFGSEVLFVTMNIRVVLKRTRTQNPAIILYLIHSSISTTICEYLCIMYLHCIDRYAYCASSYVHDE